MVLLDKIVQVFRRAKLLEVRKPSLLLNLMNGPVGGCVTVQRDSLR